MRKYLLIIFISFVISNIAKSNECVAGDCVNGDGIIDNSTFKYIGGFKNGDFHGFGIYIRKGNHGGETYAGEFKKNKYHGSGTNFIKVSGMTYSGPFKEDERHGVGICSQKGKRSVLCKYENGKFIEQISLSNEKSQNSNLILIKDILLDPKRFSNKNVSIKGWFEYSLAGDLGYIFDKENKNLYIQVQTENTSKQNKNYFFENCSNGCDITLKGKIFNDYGLNFLVLN